MAANKTLAKVTKSLCIFVSALLCISLFTAGLMAAPDCGTRCCCSIDSQVKGQHTMPMKIQSPQGCCGGNASMPCDIQNTQPHELPDALLTSSYSYNPQTMSSVVGQASFEPATFDSAGAKYSASINQHFRSPPLYLQNLAILA